MPLVSCVLPAPRSPVTPMTRPGVAARPQLSPSAWVSVGLLEMYVAMGRKRTRAGFVADGKTLALRDLANAGQFGLGKLLFPGVQQRHGIAAGNGEEQFKIFAISQCGEQRRLGGSFSL